MSRPPLSAPYEDFATVARRLNLVPRVIAGQEWLYEGSDPEEVIGLLADLEREMVRAIAENELEDAA